MPHSPAQGADYPLRRSRATRPRGRTAYAVTRPHQDAQSHEGCGRSIVRPGGSGSAQSCIDT